MSKLVDLRTAIRDIPDFPKKGILFKDITTLLKDAQAFKEAVSQMTRACADLGATHVVAIESRGYMFGGAVAYNLGLGLIPVRKPGKLPAETLSEDYELEYGTNTLEIHRDALGPGDRALIVDDLIATGGSGLATARLVERLGAEVTAFGFIVELLFLSGRERLNGYPVVSLITY